MTSQASLHDNRLVHDELANCHHIIARPGYIVHMTVGCWSTQMSQGACGAFTALMVNSAHDNKWWSTCMI